MDQWHFEGGEGHGLWDQLGGWGKVALCLFFFFSIFFSVPTCHHMTLHMGKQGWFRKKPMWSFVKQSCNYYHKKCQGRRDIWTTLTTILVKLLTHAMCVFNDRLSAHSWFISTAASRPDVSHQCNIIFFKRFFSPFFNIFRPHSHNCTVDGLDGTECSLRRVSIKGWNVEEGVLITCPPPPRPVVTEITQREWKTIDN